MWRWHSTPEVADADTGLDQTFATQADAEAWLSTAYEDLLDAGVDDVTLCEGDRVVYGPMSLHP